MVKAIVYESNTGYTKKYAELLAGETGLPAFSRAESRRALSRGDEIIFLSWVCSGTVAKLDKMKRHFCVRAACAVGLGTPTAEREAEIASHHELTAPVFCLRGGFDMSKLKGVYRAMMKLMVRSMQLQQQGGENEMLKDMQEGCDYVSAERLTPVLEWFQSQREG